jgi:uncharacterized protein with HEPN domain
MFFCLSPFPLPLSYPFTLISTFWRKNQKFLQDRKTQDAVVRNFEIMGEAAKNISHDFKIKHTDIPWQKISGLRDKLIHFYFGIDYKIVWNIARKELPKIVKQINKIHKRETNEASKITQNS